MKHGYYLDSFLTADGIFVVVTYLTSDLLR